MYIFSLHSAALFRPLLANLFLLFLVIGLFSQRAIATAATSPPGPTRYALNVTFDPSSSSLQGMARIPRNYSVVAL